MTNPQYIKQTKEQLLSVLRDMIEHIEGNDSFEGTLQYSALEEGLQREEFMLAAHWRVGNSEGQGGLRMVGNPIGSVPLVVTACEGKEAAQFEVELSWIYGPAVKHLDGKGMPMVSADWYHNRLQYQLFQEATGDPTISVRFTDGKIAEIEIPRDMKHLLVYEDQESAWIKERDAENGVEAPDRKRPS